MRADGVVRLVTVWSGDCRYVVIQRVSCVPALLGVRTQGGEDGMTQFWAFEKTVYECVTIEGANVHAGFNFYFLSFVEPWKCSFGGCYLNWTNTVNSSLAEGRADFN